MTFPSINSTSEPILFPDDTSVITASRNFEGFCSGSNFVLSRMIKWFTDDNLILNLDTMNIMKFIERNSSHSTLHIGLKEKYTEKNSEYKRYLTYRSLHVDKRADRM